VASPAVYSSTEISLRNVAAGIVVLSLVEYLFLYLFVSCLPVSGKIKMHTPLERPRGQRTI